MCKHEIIEWNDYCGTKTCLQCGLDHLSGSGNGISQLARCYCGWSADGRDGRADLIEMGEVIDDY